MPYIRTDDKFYPLFDGDLQLVEPTFNGVDIPPGYARVEPTQPPISTPNQIVLEQAPTLKNGTYKQTWQVVTLTDEQVAERNLQNLKTRAQTDGYTFDDIKAIFESGSL
jgi:hypothetical protein